MSIQWNNLRGLSEDQASDSVLFGFAVEFSVDNVAEIIGVKSNFHIFIF